MTDAFECDRCGELYGEPPELKVATNGIEEIAGGVKLKEGKSSGTTAVIEPIHGGTTRNRLNATYEIKRGDLCKDCANAFREFWGVDDE